MITAIILARANSSRLKNKHILKIGKYTLLENIYLKLKKNKNISEIFLATGSKKKNKIYNNFINSKKLKIKIFNYNKENNVTERIFSLTKKIINEYSLIISGDCPAIDNNFLDRAFKKIKNKKSDFVTTDKKTLHEGIILFKTKAWKKVEKISTNAILQENPGYALSIKKSFFNFTKFKALKRDTGDKIRLSIDTMSDLQFFRLVNYHSKKDLITYSDTIKFKKYNKINEDIIQKKVEEKKKKKIYILTSANKKIGYGHFARSKVLYRQISETYSTDITYVFYEIETKSDLKNLIKDEKYLDYQKFKRNIPGNSVTIVDLPFEYFSKIVGHIKKNQSIIIDNFSKFKKHTNILPTIKKTKSKNYNNTFSGIKYLILNKNLLFEKLHFKKKKIHILFLFGSTRSPDEKILKDILRSKIKNYLIILGPYVKKVVVRNLRKRNFKILVNPKNYYEILCISKKVICIHGVSTYEAISIGLKPSIYSPPNETKERLSDIKLLNNKNFSKNYEYQDLLNIKEFSKINPEISFGGINILRFI